MRWIRIEKIPGPLVSSYEKATRMAIDGYYKRVAEEITINPDACTILDLGTGPGYLPIEIVKRVPTVSIVGLDLSRKLIQMAQKNASQAGFADRLNFQVGNAAKLKFQSNCFDMVISTGMLHSLKDPLNVFREIYRVLKENGKAWIYDPAKVHSHIDRKKWQASLTSTEKFMLWLFKLIKLHRPIKIYSKNEIIPMLESIDFNEYWIDEQSSELRIKMVK